MPTDSSWPVSLSEEITGTKRLSPNIATKDLHQTTKPPGASLNSICPLCSGAFDNMLYVSPCLHNFCFSCIQGLLDTKAKCPCCKQPFHSVFHPVKVKDCLKELPSAKHSKEKLSSFPPSRKHPKEHAPLRSKKHLGEHSSLPSKSQSEDHITVSCEEYPLSKLHLKKQYKPFPFISPSKDSPPPCEFTKFQPHRECRHMRVLGKKPKSDKVSIEIERTEPAFRPTANFLNNDLDSFHHRVVSANLSRPGILEATLMLISSGAMVFICFYIYLRLVLLHK